MTKRSIFVAALASAISLLSFGCGGTNHLQSITLIASGTVLNGIGGTVQLTAKGNSSNGTSGDISGKVKYTVTPVGTDFQGFALPAPPLTVNYNATGQLTAVDPPTCSFTYVAKTMPPVYFLSGSYQVTASKDGVTSLPVFIAVASSSGGGPNNACNN